MASVITVSRSAVDWSVGAGISSCTSARHHLLPSPPDITSRLGTAIEVDTNEIGVCQEKVSTSRVSETIKFVAGLQKRWW